MNEQHQELLVRVRGGRIGAAELAQAGATHWGLPVEKMGWRADARVGAALAHAPTPEGSRSAAPIHLCGTGTFRGIADFVRAEAARRGSGLTVTIGDGVDPLLDLLAVEDVASDAPMRTLCLLAPEAFPDLATWTGVSEWSEAVVARAHELAAAAVRCNKRVEGPLVVTTAGTPPYALRHVQDRRLRSQAHRSWRVATNVLAGLVEQGVGVVELDELVARGGPMRDERMSLLTRAHLSDELSWAVCREAFGAWNSAEGNAIKALVVDLDGTLWSGTLAEDGTDALQMSPDTVAGAPHHHVQRVLRALHDQGVFLAVSSKNDGDEVRETLRSHPDLLVREEHVTVLRADWRPKAEHVREIADELGIALRHVAFLDDSAFERGSVRSILPDVAVVELGEDPASYASTLLACDLFNSVVLTEDDYRRNAAYREEGERSRAREASSALDVYLKSLGTELTIAPVGESELDRYIQLNNRSNRFNLNKTVLYRGDLADAAGPSTGLLALRARDAHGDLGFIGGARLVERPGEVHLESFFVSCRVLGRGLPEAAVAAIVRASLDTAARVTATYSRTQRNEGVAGFYLALGGLTESENDTETRYLWDRASASRIPETPHVAVSMRGAPRPRDGGTR